jgi:hypothetical protein
MICHKFLHHLRFCGPQPLPVLGSGVLGLKNFKGNGDRDFDDLIASFNFKLSTGAVV